MVGKTCGNFMILAGNSSILDLTTLELEVRGPKLKRSKCSNAEMASSSSAVSPASFGSLPDEIALKILKMAAWNARSFWYWKDHDAVFYDSDGDDDDDDYGHWYRPRYDFDFLVDVISKVSTRFKELATDHSFWQGTVVIHNPTDPRKVEFIVQKCLNPGTREFVLAYPQDSDEAYDLLTCPRYDEFINPAKRFPNLKLVRPIIDFNCLEWRWSDDSSQSRDEKESPQ